MACSCVRLNHSDTLPVLFRTSLFFGLLAAVVTLSCLPPAVAATVGQRQLQLRNAQGALLFSQDMDDNAVFGIRFLHSVALSPVEEWFRLEKGAIVLEKTVYQDFGAGLPHAPGPGQTMTCQNGHLVMSGYHRRLPTFDVRVGRVANHVLLLPGADGAVARIPLNTLAPPGSAVTFAIATLPGTGAQPCCNTQSPPSADAVRHR